MVGLDRVYDIALSWEVQSEGLDSSLEEAVLVESYLPGASFSLKQLNFLCLVPVSVNIEAGPSTA